MPERHDVNETPRERIIREAAHELASDMKASDLAIVTRGKWRRDLVIFGALIIILFGAERFFDHQSREQNRDIFLDALETDCENDTVYRQQLKVRGQAEKKLLSRFLDLARQNVREGRDRNGISEDFITDFKPLTKKIKIYPVPDCDKDRDELEDRLYG